MPLFLNAAGLLHENDCDSWELHEFSQSWWTNAVLSLLNVPAIASNILIDHFRILPQHVVIVNAIAI